MDDETQTGTDTQSYVFDARWQQERERLGHLESAWDGLTLRRLDELGVAPGWRCLEVGAGGGSVAAWLCDRVGPAVSVVATDIDTRFLDVLKLPNLEVRRHDITSETAGEADFDLVHARLLLEHLPAYREALRHMVAALKPGGVLLIEDFDHTTFQPDPGAGEEALRLWRSFSAAFEALAAGRGLDLGFGRRLHGLLAETGLEDVVAEGRSVIHRGGEPVTSMLRLSLLSLRDGLVSAGAMPSQDVDALVTLLQEPSFRLMSQLMVGASGRRAA